MDHVRSCRWGVIPSFPTSHTSLLWMCFGDARQLWDQVLCPFSVESARSWLGGRPWKPHIKETEGGVRGGRVCIL